MMIRIWLAVLLCAWPMAAQAAWHEASSAHFVVYSDDRPDAIRRFAEELERVDKGMRLLRNVADHPVGAAGRVTVYVVDDADDVARLAGDHRVAGFYIPRASGPLAIVPRRRVNGGAFGMSEKAVLLHEYAHHFMYSTWPSAVFPSWLIEGFAEFHGTATVSRDGTVLFGSTPAYRAPGLMLGPKLTIANLLAFDARSMDAATTDVFYGRGWALTHYLTFNTDRKRELDGYIAALNSGKSTADAAKSFGDLGALDRELNRYIRRSRLSALEVAAQGTTPGPITIRALTPGEAATMDVRIRSQRGVSDRTAPAVATAARRAAQGFPNDPGAQLALAEAEFDARQYAAAEAAADRALAADPRRVDALVYKGRARAAATLNEGSRDAARWRDIRRLFVQANRLDPDDPEPLMHHFASFEQAGETAPANARAGLLRAFELAPFDPDLRLQVAVMNLRLGKAAEARAALAPIAFNPHGGEAASHAAALIARIDAGDLAGALASFETSGKNDARSAE